MEGNPYLILVHGTFGAPVSDRIQWYQFDPNTDSNFAAQLLKHMRSLGHNDVRYLQIQERNISLDQLKEFQVSNGDSEVFRIIAYTWAGTNDHHARRDAGYALADLVEILTKHDRFARIHFLAHSHGGNVVLKALEWTLTRVALEMRVPEDDVPLRHLANLRGYRYNSVGRRRPRTRVYRGREWNLGNKYEYTFTSLRDWLRSRSSNRIGRIVFLGTPFIEKRWNHGKHPVYDRLAKSVLIAGDALYAALIPWLPIAAVCTIFALMRVPAWLGGHFDTLLPWSLNPLDWHWLAQLGFYTFVVCLTYGGARFRVDESRWVAIRNFYFDEEVFGPHLELLAPGDKESDYGDLRLQSLVIHCGLLDEALLGLSSEPIVYGLLAPRINKLFERNTNELVQMRDLSRVIRSLGRWMVGPLRSTTNRLVRWILTYPRRFVQARLKRTMLKIISSTALGIPPSEFRAARFFVKHSIDAPHVFRSYEWNVAMHVSKGAGLTNKIASPAVERYRFLHDNREFSELLARSNLWRAIASNEDGVEDLGELRNVYEGYSGLGSDGMPPELRRIAVTLERRLEEILLDMAHLRYYASEDVMCGIVEFLIKGEVGPDARETAGLNLSMEAIVMKDVYDNPELIAFLYREPPQKEADSGWRIGQNEKVKYDSTVDNFVWLPLRDVLWASPQLEDMLLTPVGSVFQRAPKSSSFVRVSTQETGP